ncbi:hypothetical protein BX600DRAFT_431782 [Xylariales sp. PMI_506]|nr:hypothetical protein BX600DRAFT_431782 [Xylariales sp. PMI_506]
MVQLPIDVSFVREIWTLYAVGMVILILRLFVRFKTVGLYGFQGDDYLALVLIGLHTIDTTLVHIIHFTGTNVEATQFEKTQPLTSDDIAQFVYGSKAELVAWYIYVSLLWCLKGSMLFFYKRISIGNINPKTIQWISVGTFAAYLVVIFTISLTAIYSSDLVILSIPVPLMGLLNVSLKRKLFIGVLLCSGVFIIAASVTRVVVTLSAHPSATTINAWGIRESIVGLVAINLPILRPLFTYSFWTGRTRDTRIHDSEQPIRRNFKKPLDTLLSIDLFSTLRNKTNISRYETQRIDPATETTLAAHDARLDERSQELGENAV